MQGIGPSQMCSEIYTKNWLDDRHGWRAQKGLEEGGGLTDKNEPKFRHEDICGKTSKQKYDSRLSVYRMQSKVFLPSGRHARQKELQALRHVLEYKSLFFANM